MEQFTAKYPIFDYIVHLQEPTYERLCEILMGTPLPGVLHTGGV